MTRRKVLVVDDDEVARQLLKEVLEKEGIEVVTAASGEEAVELSKKSFYPILISDIRMLELDGLDLLKHFKVNHPRTVVILMTAFASMETAVEAIKEGAFDYLSKPFKIKEFRSLFKKALKHAESLHNPPTNISNTPSNKEVKTLIGSSPKMLEIFKTLARAAMSQASVLIIGESGTGKELIARAIFENSDRKKKKFVTINCGSLTDTLLESELFGHVKGSFTGAHENRRGIFEEANGGTLFLDEIGDITPSMQVKLLRVLQEGEFKPVGSNDSKTVDVRILAATHQDLAQLVKDGKFREDLFYRLKVISITLPPLRERREDIEELSGHFLTKYAEKNGKKISHFTEAALDLLKKYTWPGNVRQLENVVERAVALSNTSRIDAEDLPEEICQGEPDLDHKKGEAPLSASLEDLERNHILQILTEVHYNKSKAAEILGIDRTTLYRKAQKYGIDLKER